MKSIFNYLALSGLVSCAAMTLSPAYADTLTTVTTTTTEAPVSSYTYTRRIVPVTEKQVTITKSSVVKRSCSTHRTACTHHYTHHYKKISYSRPRTNYIASSTTTKTVTRTIEKPVVVKKVVSRPVYINRYIERPVYTERVFERPVVVERTLSSPVLVKEKISHHSDHDTISIKRYF
ncbi:MAG TPA: hypothetical protein V6C97_34325 [Oculatellaceae cyanobacterium]